MAQHGFADGEGRRWAAHWPYRWMNRPASARWSVQSSDHDSGLADAAFRAPRPGTAILTRPILVAAACALVAAVAAADLMIANLSLTWPPFIMLGVVLATVAQVMLLRSVTGSSFPFGAIPVVAFNLVGVAGYLYYRSVEGVADVANALPDGAREFNAAAGIFAIASLSITGGAMLGAIRRRHVREIAVDGESPVDLPSALARVPTVPVLVTSTIPIILTVLGTGPAELISRAHYLDTAGPLWMVTLSDVLAPLGVAGASMVLFGKRTPVGRLLAGLLLLAYVAVLLARDTRRLALVPLIMLALYIAQRGGRARRMVPVALAAIFATFVVLQLQLALREQVSTAGLGPYVAALIQNPTLILGSSVSAVVGNVLYSVPLTGFVATDVPSLPAGALVTSLSPLPGDMTNWPVIAPLLRVSIYTPFSSLGELALQGTLVSVLYFSFVGYLATRLQVLGARLHGLRSSAMQLALGGLIAVFSVSALQYNLRSSTRYIWYAFGLYLVLRFVPVLKRGRPRSHPRVHGAADSSASGRMTLRPSTVSKSPEHY